ncbi:heme-binding protein 2-like [Palaemon carinicauda]|uniref:heme-binding protein 2-like n=1 Tax=Palaemon carinicauda TaxID=392227 RepID=UPI0035B60966
MFKILVTTKFRDRVVNSARTRRELVVPVHVNVDRSAVILRYKYIKVGVRLWVVAEGDTIQSIALTSKLDKFILNYEIRSYAPANWVCRDHTGDNFRNRDQAMSFFDLFDYITGQNSAETDIKMTAPVTVHTQNNFDAQGNSQYKMCFYLPAIHQANPPSPKNSAVYIENRPALILAARRFGGFVKGQRDWNEHKEALKADMKADNELDFDFDNFYGASYDSPYTFKDRRNEVWVAKLQ